MVIILRQKHSVQWKLPNSRKPNKVHPVCSNFTSMLDIFLNIFMGLSLRNCYLQAKPSMAHFSVTFLKQLRECVLLRQHPDKWKRTLVCSSKTKHLFTHHSLLDTPESSKNISVVLQLPLTASLHPLLLSPISQNKIMAERASC